MTRWKLLLQLTRGKTWPVVDIGPGAELLSEKAVDDVKTQIYHLDCYNNLCLDIGYKSADETVLDEKKNIIRDQTVSIHCVWVDNIKVDKQILSRISAYQPVYREDFLEYCQKNSISLTDTNLSNFKFWHSGRVTISWHTDFWHTYQHHRQMHKLSHHDLSKTKEHIGYNQIQTKQSLTALKGRLS